MFLLHVDDVFLLFLVVAYFQSFLDLPQGHTASVSPLSGAMCRTDLPSRSNLSTKVPENIGN